MLQLIMCEGCYVILDCARASIAARIYERAPDKYQLAYVNISPAGLTAWYIGEGLIADMFRSPRAALDHATRKHEELEAALRRQRDPDTTRPGGQVEDGS